MARLANKNILITSGNSGIGLRVSCRIPPPFATRIARAASYVSWRVQSPWNSRSTCIQLSFLQSAKSQVVAIGSQAAHASAAMETSNSSLSAVGAEKETQASVI